MLNAYYSTYLLNILGTGDKKVNKRKVPAFMELTF